MSRLIAKTGIELPTFSPALGPESANRKPKKFTGPPESQSNSTANANTLKIDLPEFNFMNSEQFNFDSFNQFLNPNDSLQFSRYEPINFNYNSYDMQKSFGQNEFTNISFPSFFNDFQLSI